MKTLYLATTVLALALVSATSAHAQTTSSPTVATPNLAPAAAMTVTLTPSVVSQYMFRGARLGGPSFEPEVEVDSGNLSLGVWSNFPLRNKVPGQSDPEIDPYGSYKFAVNDAFSIQPGFTWYTYLNADKSAGFYKETFESNIAFNYTVSGLTFTPKFYYDVVLRGPTYELDATYAIPLKKIGTELDLSATIGTFKWTQFAPTTPDTKNSGDYWLVGATVPFTITKESKLSLGWTYTEGRNNHLKQGSAPKTINPQAVGRGVATVSCPWTF